MQLTTSGQTNITAAYSAVSLWKKITNHEEFSAQPPPIRVLCNSLYASSLSRVGRDKDALKVHDCTLSLIHDNVDDSINDSIEIDVRIGRGEALQRLMRYDSSRSDFLAVCKLSQDRDRDSPMTSVKGKVANCAYSAVLCSLRLDDFEGAESILSSVVPLDRIKDLNDIDANLVGLYGAVLWELHHRSTCTAKEAASNGSSLAFTPLQLLQYAASSPNASPIYQWFFAVASKSTCDFFQGGVVSSMEKDSLLQIASINQSPFDDPALIHLDDKVLLHDLLIHSGTASVQWPKGYVLPRDQTILQDFCAANPETRWIMKERAGYGSHGNRIVDNLGIEALTGNRDSGQLVLCQMLIEPSMLYHGRKFSIRVYVVYIKNCTENNRSSVYLLNQGLAKLAESVYENSSSSSTDEIYMTNSGRIEGDGMIQYDFESLKAFMEDQYGNEAFINMWDSVKKSVSDVLQGYLQSDCNDSSDTLLFSTVPKIMGFDYIIDTNLKPWLMEVNRFPGLEARGSVDTNVKNHVIETAWRLASFSAKTDCGLSLENDNLQSAVQELNCTVDVER